jgi:hypothetical protein
MAPAPEAETLKSPDGVTPDDEGWQDYVLSQLRENEFVLGDDGTTRRPRINGLRRLTEKLVGKIYQSESRVIKAPTKDDMTATVEHAVTFENRTITECADVSLFNADDEYARFPVAVASTRAEGRALRKALYLYSVVTAEEVTNKTTADIGMTWAAGEGSTSAQRACIEKLCGALGVSVDKLLQYGERSYSSIAEMNKATATKVIEFLNSIQQGKVSVPEEIKG